MNTPITRSCVAASAACLLAAHTHAGEASVPLVVQEDLRSVSTSADMSLADAGGGAPDLFSQSFDDMPDPLFGAFDSSRLSLLLGPDGNTTTALSVQDSAPFGSGLVATGVVETQVNLADVAPGSSGMASASSVYSALLTVPEGRVYQVAIGGSIRAESPDQDGKTLASARVSLRGYIEVVPGGNGEFPVDGLVNLPAGNHYFETIVSSEAFATEGNPGQSEAEFSVQVEVVGEPCTLVDLAAPFGTLDLRDIEAFVNGYLARNTGLSDIAEPFGVLCLEDIGAFVGGFVAGCP